MHQWCQSWSEITLYLCINFSQKTKSVSKDKTNKYLNELCLHFNIKHVYTVPTQEYWISAHQEQCKGQSKNYTVRQLFRIKKTTFSLKTGINCEKRKDLCEEASKNTKKSAVWDDFELLMLWKERKPLEFHSWSVVCHMDKV